VKNLLVLVVTVLLLGTGALAQQQVVCTASGEINIQSPAYALNCGPAGAPIWWVADYSSTQLDVHNVASDNDYQIQLQQNSWTNRCDTLGDPNACLNVYQGAESACNGVVCLALSLTGTEKQ